MMNIPSYTELSQLKARGNDSFYLLDLAQLKKNYQQFSQAFAQYYANTQVAYSFKTNYTPEICRFLKEQGCWAEVVSAMEYHIATTVVGYSPQHIIINGPIHDKQFLEQALLAGATLNVDSWATLDTVQNICRLYPSQHFTLGIRLTYDLVEGGFSRFGIEYNDENITRLQRWFYSVPNCTLAGLHSHFSHSSRSLRSFHDRITTLLMASQQLFTKAPPQWINVGGGFLGEMPPNLAKQYPEVIPSFTEYAATITQAIKAVYPQQPLLFLEPGTALVANTVVFACPVYEVKQVNHKTLVVVHGSNHNIRHKWSHEQLPLQIVSPLSSTEDHALIFDIVGNTCIEKDVLATDVSAPIHQGDYIIFEYMGGYSYVLKQPFIHPCQPVYAKKNDDFICIKRQENTEDILSTYL